jgi:thioredoxin-like negative regulator of GroEL
MKKLLLLLLFLGLCLITKSQDIPQEGLAVVEFNAPFSGTKCEYLGKLSDCETSRIDISKNAKIGPKHKIVVVPTLVIFKDGEEVARFQANIMMQLEATKDEVQEKIDEILMEDF